MKTVGATANVGFFLQFVFGRKDIWERIQDLHVVAEKFLVVGSNRMEL